MRVKSLILLEEKPVIKQAWKGGSGSPVPFPCAGAVGLSPGTDGATCLSGRVTASPSPAGRRCVFSTAAAQGLHSNYAAGLFSQAFFSATCICTHPGAHTHLHSAVECSLGQAGPEAFSKPYWRADCYRALTLDGFWWGLKWRNSKALLKEPISNYLRNSILVKLKEL